MTTRKQYAADVRAAAGDRRLLFTISTGALDRDRDRIDPTGWDVSAYLKNPVVLWAHKYDGLPIAKAVDIRATPDALRAVAEFATHQLADDVFQLYEGGFLSAVSVGFIAGTRAPNADGGFDIASAELLEFSCVPVPANPEALIAAAAKGLRLDPAPVAPIDGDELDALCRALGLEVPTPELFDDVVLAAAVRGTIDEIFERALRRRTGRLPE